MIYLMSDWVLCDKPCSGCRFHCVLLAHGDQVWVYAIVLRDEHLDTSPVITEHEHHVVAGWKLLDELERWREACLVIADAGKAVAEDVESDLCLDGLDGVCEFDHQEVAKLPFTYVLPCKVIDALLN